jgi:hypothetical protein
MDDLVIAVVMFDGAEEQDIVGPYEMFWWMSLFGKLPPAQPISESDFLTTFTSREGSWPNLFTVAPTAGPATTDASVRFRFGPIATAVTSRRCSSSSQRARASVISPP